MAVTETLRTVLDAGGTSRRLDELSTARVILKVAEQVHAAQQKAGAGKAIGPLTPSSITIETATGAVKLALAEPSAFAYAAPEQLDGAEGDRRSDVWSLGVVMWEALTHQPLFEGGDDAAIRAAVKQQTVDPPASSNANIPAELSAICMRALARNPADRYQSAKVMSAELEAVLDDAGYGDNDDKLREYMATLGQPKREPKLSTPPMTVTPAKGLGVGEPPADMLTPPPGPPSSTSPGVVIPRGDAAPAAKAVAAPITVGARAVGTTPPAEKPIERPVEKVTDKPSDRASRPSILDQEPAKPPASMVATSAGSLDTKTDGLSPTSFLKSPAPAASPGTNLAAALASAGTQAAPAKAERVGFQTIHAAAAPMPSITAPPSTIPMAPVLPKATSSGTSVGFSKEAEAHEAPPVTAVEIQKPADVAHVPSLVASAAAANAASSATVPAPATPAASTPAVKRDPTPAPRTRAPTNPPDPAAVVSLPKAGRESAEVLGGWGWGTDSHEAIKPYEHDDDLHAESGTNKRLLFYVFGGGFAVVALILIVVFAFGGSKKTDDKLAAKTGSGSAEIAYGSGVEYGKATGDPTGGSAIASGAEPGSNADTGSAAALAGSAGSGVADNGSAMVGSDVGSNTVAANPPPVVADAAIANTPPPPAPPDAAPVAVKPPPEPVKPKQPEKVAVAPPPPHKPPEKPPVKRPETHTQRPQNHIADPFATQHPPAAETKADAEAAYRQGVQLFARGDTSSALAQMRSSIASNPDYAPAWRGLGLVFEKMGEKDQARSAYKRYLKLAPSANDVDQIRNRMERL